MGQVAIGIDPGMAACGWAVVERVGGVTGSYRLVQSGTIRTSTADDDDTRIRHVIWEVCDASRFMASVGVEAIEVRRQRGAEIHPRSLVTTALVAGGLLGWFGDKAVRFVRASDWRRAIGAGHGSAAEVRAAVERLVGPVKGSVHVCDAIGIALWRLRDADVRP